MCRNLGPGDNGACLDRNMVRSGIYARPDGFQRSIGNSCGCKNRINMVPGKRAWRGDRCFQYGHLTRRDACSTVDCLVHYVSFIVSGSLALLAALFWFFCYKDPKDAKRLSDEERHYIESGQEQHLKTDKKEKTSIKHILSQRNFWGIGIARFLADPAWGTINFWVPIFFVETLHFSLKEIAMFVWLPFLLGDLGCLASGFVAKFFHDRGVSLINSRRITFTIAAVIMMTIGLVSIVENPYIAVLLISIGAFSHQCLSTVAATLGGDLFKKDEVATAVGMAGACAWSGQLIFNLFIGAFVHIIGFAPFFIALAFFDIIGAIALWTLIKVKDEEPQVQLATS